MKTHTDTETRTVPNANYHLTAKYQSIANNICFIYGVRFNSPEYSKIVAAIEAANPGFKVRGGDYKPNLRNADGSVGTAVYLPEVDGLKPNLNAKVPDGKPGGRGGRVNAPNNSQITQTRTRTGDGETHNDDARHDAWTDWQ